MVSPRLASAVPVLVLVLAGCAGSQGTVAPSPAPAVAAADTAKAKPDRAATYKSVITAEAVTDEGVFDVHRVDEKLFFEIPDSLLNHEMLLVSRIARTAHNIGYGGEELGTQVIRWQRQDDNILLRTVSYENVASEDKPF